jgi:N-carbamoyl-L-amino-acid hydrolase
MEDRADPMATYAVTALWAYEEARANGQRATFGRLEVIPNGTNAVPSLVRAWLDARAESEEQLAELLQAVERRAQDQATRDGTALKVIAESASGAVTFDPDLAARLAAGHDGGEWPIIPTAAGHDAGILAQAGIPTAMLFVRNPSGISHSPEEKATMSDCLAGVEALADTLARLAT